MPTDTIKQVYGDSDTIYRVRPNPDGSPGDWCGVVLDWSDDGGQTWHGQFFLGPDIAEEFAKAIADIVKENN